MRIILTLLSLLIASSLIVSCATQSVYNDTVFPFDYNEDLAARKPIKNVIVAPVSLGVPAPSYLEFKQRVIRQMVADYLRDNGYNVLPDYQFENAWLQASRTYGDVYDPTTGRIDANAWRAAMVTVGQQLREQTQADAIVFADLFTHDVQHSSGFSHYARFYGVARKPVIKGGATTLPAEFNWSETVKAASLMVTIYNVDLERVFTSRGGIDTLDEIDSRRATPSFVRRKNFLKSEAFAEEGIALAFHPFIPMDNYPGVQE